MSTTQKVLSVIVVAAVIAGGWYLLSRHAGVSDISDGADETVASVNGAPITRAELISAESRVAAQQGAMATSTAALAEFQSGALDLLIGQELLKQGAKQAGITASSTAVDAQLASIKAQFSTSDDYTKGLAAQGLTEDELRARISDNIIINAYVEKELALSTLTATDAEIKALYAKLTAQQTAGATTPPLSEVRSQLAQMIVQQKQQDSITAYVAKLRSSADVKILIAAPTPAV